MSATFFDTHAHLGFPDFENRVEEIIARAKERGVSRIITIGTDLEGSMQAVAIAERYEPVYASVGWHPSDCTSAPQKLPAEFRKLAEHPKVVAIGETGLDFSRLPSKSGGTEADDARYKERQLQLFIQQLELAALTGHNVIIHQRDCFAETLTALRPWSKKLRAVFHCFVGTEEERIQIAALGSIVSYTGIVTFKNAIQVRETMKRTPLGSFMLETDSPFLAPVPHRGKRCEPAFVADTARFVADEKGCSVEELSAATCETARTFFSKLK